MAPSKNAERDAREARERLRRYNARQAVHTHQVTRRRRDNILAILGVVLIAGLATVTQVFYFTAGPGMPTPTPGPSSSTTVGKNTGDVPAKTIAKDRTWTGSLTLNTTSLGIEILGKAAPQAASVFIKLTQDKFYLEKADTCHRLTNSGTAGLIQCGSPNGDGTGDAGFAFGPEENVPADGNYPAGTIAMARSTDPYSQGSQFFITYTDTYLDPSTGGYTIFGKVTSGLDSFVANIASGGIADGSSDGKPMIPVKITKLTLK